MDIIVGGGKYGCRAVDFLKQKGRNFVLVDTNPDCLAVEKFGLKHKSNINSGSDHFVQGGLGAVLDMLESLKPEFLFPTAPVHIVAELAKIKFDLEPWCGGIDSALLGLPQSVVLLAGKGKLILSFNRDNECLDRCTMPKICPSSGTIKPCTMTELVRYASPETFVLVSYSMAPGMGALKGGDLRDFFKWAKAKKKFSVATTCNCHGVLSAFKSIRPRRA